MKYDVAALIALSLTLTACGDTAKLPLAAVWRVTPAM
jgi:hypothetical protein